MDKVLELNKILDEEIEFCEKYEELLEQKKTILIHSQPSKLKDFDEKIRNAHRQLQELDAKRIDITKHFGNDEMTLSEIIKSLGNTAEANILEDKRQKIQSFSEKISTVNIVIKSLIEHSIKMIDGSIGTIADAMSKNQSIGDCYNNLGRKEKQPENILSAIIEEA